MDGEGKVAIFGFRLRFEKLEDEESIYSKRLNKVDIKILSFEVSIFAIF